MTFRHCLLMASAPLALCAAPAMAQATPPADAAAMQQELQALRERLAALEARLLAAEQRAAAEAAAPPAAPVPVVPPVAAAAKPADKVTWKGAPEFARADGWSFKPRGRLQVDVSGVNAPDALDTDRLGTGLRLRRARLGFDGTMPGGFGYRAEVDLAASSVNITDMYLNYTTGGLTVTAGQVKPFWSLEEMTSDLFTSFTERAAFNTAFGFERRVGLSASYKAGDVALFGGVFGDNANDLLDDRNNSISFDGRAVFMPKWGSTQFHLGGSIHHRKFNDIAAAARYRARPFVRSTDVRLIDTGNIAGTAETGFGVETAVISGPFHATAEGFWQRVARPGLADPTFFGGYAEIGMVLTPGDQSGYRGGVYDRLKPSNPVSEGGPGAIQVNARFDHLDLVNQGISGGRQNLYGLSAIWVPVDHVKFVMNYVHIDYSRAAITAAGDPNYGVDAFGVRTQIDF